MKLAKKFKSRPRIPLFAWVVWPCGDITKHEILSEAICPFSLSRVFELRTEYGPIYKSWTGCAQVGGDAPFFHSPYRLRNQKVAPDWTS